MTEHYLVLAREIAIRFHRPGLRSAVCPAAWLVLKVDIFQGPFKRMLRRTERNCRSRPRAMSPHPYWLAGLPSVAGRQVSTVRLEVSDLKTASIHQGDSGPLRPVCHFIAVSPLCPN